MSDISVLCYEHTALDSWETWKVFLPFPCASLPISTTLCFCHDVLHILQCNTLYGYLTLCTENRQHVYIYTHTHTHTQTHVIYTHNIYIYKIIYIYIIKYKTFIFKVVCVTKRWARIDVDVLQISFVGTSERDDHRINDQSPERKNLCQCFCTSSYYYR
jgi:hypothetical protein